MIESFSINLTATTNAALQFENNSITKGETVVQSTPTTFTFNKCGVYMVSVDGVAAASTTIQLYKDGVAQPQAQSTGTTVGFITLVQVPRNNNCCPCSSPVKVQVMNTTATTFDNINICITKIC